MSTYFVESLLQIKLTNFFHCWYRFANCVGPWFHPELNFHAIFVSRQTDERSGVGGGICYCSIRNIVWARGSSAHLDRQIGLRNSAAGSNTIYNCVGFFLLLLCECGSNFWLPPAHNDSSFFCFHSHLYLLNIYVFCFVFCTHNFSLFVFI